MKLSMFRVFVVCLFSISFLAGCAHHAGSEFIGTWVNTHDANDSFEIVRNGDQFLIESKGNKVGASYDKGMLEVKGILGTTELTYVQKTCTISTPGFLGPVEYMRKK
jgi:hypothetical protein